MPSTNRGRTPTAAQPDVEPRPRGWGGRRRPALASGPSGTPSRSAAPAGPPVVITTAPAVSSPVAVRTTTPAGPGSTSATFSLVTRRTPAATAASVRPRTAVDPPAVEVEDALPRGSLQLHQRGAGVEVVGVVAVGRHPQQAGRDRCGAGCGRRAGGGQPVGHGRPGERAGVELRQRRQLAAEGHLGPEGHQVGAGQRRRRPRAGRRDGHRPRPIAPWWAASVPFGSTPSSRSTGRPSPPA